MSRESHLLQNHGTKHSYIRRLPRRGDCPFLKHDTIKLQRPEDLDSWTLVYILENGAYVFKTLYSYGLKETSCVKTIA